MNNFKITHLSGRSDIIEDHRSIEDLTAALCQDGYLVVNAKRSGYSTENKPLSILERAVATIELLD